MADDASSSRGPMDMDIDPEPVKKIEKLEKFSKEAARAFFKEFGLISHQINSYNDFIGHGLQDLFDSLGEVNVEPGYDPSKKGDSAWKHATISFGKVHVERPTFWITKGDEPEMIKMTPRHARLQNMTYSGVLHAEVRVQVRSEENKK
jgi:DNA-directed RNA polymerase IV and V subunit 2